MYFIYRAQGKRKKKKDGHEADDESDESKDIWLSQSCIFKAYINFRKLRMLSFLGVTKLCVVPRFCNKEKELYFMLIYVNYIY